MNRAQEIERMIALLRSEPPTHSADNFFTARRIMRQAADLLAALKSEDAPAPVLAVAVEAVAQWEDVQGDDHALTKAMRGLRDALDMVPTICGIADQAHAESLPPDDPGKT